MQCRCGYSFAKAMLSATRAGDPWGAFESFMVVRNRDFEAFFQREKVADACPDKESLAYLGKLAESADLTGSLMLCPECGCLVFHPPGPDEQEVTFYERRE
jgi:hypothetical protein